MEHQTCSYDGCGRLPVAKALCQTHYNQQRRGEELQPILGRGGRNRTYGVCAFDGCDRRAASKGYCQAHRAQQLRGDDMQPIQVRKDRVACLFDPCDRISRVHGLCEAHYTQERRGRTLVPIAVPKYRYETPSGYVMLYEPEHPNAQKNGMVLEHVKVMSDRMGRPLWSDENVHHVNGQRGDNRLSNLELWSTRQPKGQRVEDKVEFALEMLRRYRPELLKEP